MRKIMRPPVIESCAALATLAVVTCVYMHWPSDPMKSFSPFQMVLAFFMCFHKLSMMFHQAAHRFPMHNRNIDHQTETDKHDKRLNIAALVFMGATGILPSACPTHNIINSYNAVG